ncbi:unnamed protein product [Schistosoma mattheei]|uniref:Uncharacterized protein n=1 Tax=Schistosoma mattheei TaxID=31246 RepID=A0AA85BHT8_9TREM|nr:unnamed protein product [Schistosoma mattheei]
MSQIGSAYQNKLRMQSPNTLPSKQKSEILYNTNHSTYTTEYQETFNEDKKLPKKDSIETVENIVEQQQHREQQTTVGNFKCILLNLPLFFVQKVVRKNNPIKKSAIKQMENNKTTNKRRQRYLLPDLSNKKTGRFKLHKANLRSTKVNKASSAKWQAAQRKLTILLIVIICLFIAGQIPQAFAYITIFEAFNRHFGNSKSKLSFTNQHKSISLPHNSLYYRMCKRRRSSTLFCNPTKRLISIDNTDLSSEAVSAPVDLCTSSKWKNKDFLQLSEMKKDLLSTPIHHSPQCINKINSIIKTENTIDYIKMNYSSVPAINEVSNYLVISNPVNTDNNLLYKPIETQFQQSSLITKIMTYQLNSQNTKQITTSQSHSIYSNQLITNKDNLNNDLQHGQYVQNYDKRKEDMINNAKQNIIHCVNLNMLRNSNNNNKDYYNKSNDNISNSTNSSTSKNSNSAITNSKTCTHSIIDSDSHGVGLTFSHVYCPLIYRESDFDVISVDESNAQDEPEPNSFL